MTDPGLQRAAQAGSVPLLFLCYSARERPLAGLVFRRGRRVRGRVWELFRSGRPRASHAPVDRRVPACAGLCRGGGTGVTYRNY